jgi:hypothetical protein
LFSPSTNLEKVAGQLVTFFSGLAFASLLTIPQYIYMFSKFFETGIHGSGAALVGAGFITFFGPLGFITAYVVTRTIGAQAFARSDSELIGITAVITNRHPMLPDVQQEDNADLSDPDRMAIVVTASVPFAELDSIDDFRTWGRAHALLGDYKGALQAFDRAYRLNPTDARIVLDYATALYQDPDWTDPEYVLRKARDAEALESPASSASLRARTKNLQIATMLYVPGRYIDAVIAANDFLRSDLPRVHTIRLYRACGLGQLLWAYVDANRLAIGGPGWNAVMEVIRFDASVVAELDEVVCRQLRMVIDPNGREYPADCDLQFAAIHDAQLTKIAKLPAPPPPPDPACKPTLADVPNPAPPGAPDWEVTVMAWVATFP